MPSSNNIQDPTSVKRKVIAGFLLVFIAIFLALGIAHFGFREMMETVDQLSAPNEELNALNNIFHEITAFDQMQRELAIENPKKPYKTFLGQSNSLENKIDSLILMDWDSTQQVRLFEIKQILQKRNRLFFSYLKLKSGLENQTLTNRLDTLSQILGHEKITFDTSVVTTEKKTTTTYTRDSVPDNDNRSGIAKFFSKKKKTPPPTTHIKVQQELSVMVDTLSIARQNRALAEVEKIIVDLESDQRAESNRLFHEELELIHANSLLINELLSILHDVENEELAQMGKNNDAAAALVTSSLLRISILLLVFLVSAAVLVYLIWIDITKSNYYKEQLEKAKNEAEELGMIKQRFLANMSHEIRTPLQSIIGFAEQLNKHEGTDQDAVSAIYSSSEHLLHIVDEVLDYSRISSGSLAISKENFKLMTLIKEVESAVRIQADRKNLTLLLDTEQTENLNLLGDPFRLRQILYNLLGNAIKFTSRGYVKLSIKTVEIGNSVRCQFNVSDTGMGIDQGDLTKIFNQFEQANSQIVGQHGGTGLGLSIVKSLVEAQGGTIDVSSQPGLGSSFSVNLTYEYAQNANESMREKAFIQPSTVFTGKVILIDDDTLILRLCSLIMTKNNIQFTAYNDAQTLLQEIPDPAVTHILMDIRMPGINGIELCGLLREKYVPTPIFIAVTAHVLPQDRQQLISEGFDNVIAKPFREQDLLSLLGIRLEEKEFLAEPHVDDVDLSTLRKMTLGDEKLLQSIISQFIDETERDLLRLDKILTQRSPAPTREIIHKLAGRIGQIGSDALAGKLQEIETKMEREVPLTDLIENIARVAAEVRILISKIRASPVTTTR